MAAAWLLVPAILAAPALGAQVVQRESPPSPTDLPEWPASSPGEEAARVGAMRC